MPSPNVAFRASNGLDAELASRGASLSAVSARDLTRYYNALESALESAQISTTEMDYLADILSGTYLEPSIANYLWAEVDDAEPAYAQRWGIDAAALRDRLRAMPEFTSLAIIDALERHRHAAQPMAELSVP